MANQLKVSPNISVNPALSQIDKFEEVFRLLKSDSSSEVAKAMDLFSKMPKEARDSVYQAFYNDIPFQRQPTGMLESYPGYEIDAFHDQKGLSSTSAQKAHAVQIHLIQMIASSHFNLPEQAANPQAIHLLLGRVADALATVGTLDKSVANKSASDAIIERCKAFVSRLPPEVRGKIYEELYHLHTFKNEYWGCAEDAFYDRNGQRCTSELKSQAIQNYLLRNLADLFKSGDPGSVQAAFEIFNKMPQEQRASVLEGLYNNHNFNRDYWGCAEDALNDRNGESTTSEEKSQAFLNCIVKKEVIQQPVEPVMSKPEPAPLHQETAAERKDKNIKELEAKCPKTSQPDPQVKTGEYYIRHSSSYEPNNPSFTLVLCPSDTPLNRVLIQFDPKTGDFCARFETFKSFDELLNYFRVKPISTPAPSLPKSPGPLIAASPLLIAAEPLLNPNEVLHEINEAEDLFGEGYRSTASNTFIKDLSNCKLGSWLQINGEDFYPVSGSTQNFSTNQLVSCGSSDTREIIVLDPRHSPKLAKHYTELRKKLHPGMTTKEILELTLRYVRTQIFPSCTSVGLVKDLNEKVENARNTHPTVTKKGSLVKIPMIPLDDFVESAAVCRHHALATAYLLDRLLKEQKPLIKGTVQHIRGNLDSFMSGGGAHVWTTFIPKREIGAPAEKWHLDTLWGELRNFAESEELDMLRMGYGKKMMDDQIKRTTNAARKNGQPI